MNITDGSDNTALMHAAWNGYNKCVDLLLQGGANINQTNTSGETALLSASRGGHEECVKELINAGA